MLGVFDVPILFLIHFLLYVGCIHYKASKENAALFMEICVGTDSLLRSVHDVCMPPAIRCNFYG